MGQFFNKVLAFLNINRGRDLPLFLVSLALAFCIWFIYKILPVYSNDMEVSVKAVCNIDGHSAEAADNYVVSARCKSYGYNIIRRKLFPRKRPVEVTFSRLHPTGEGDVFYITASEMGEYSEQLFGKKNTVEAYGRDTFYFRFPYEDCRKLPVEAVCEIEYEPQYMMVGDMALRPDSVTVYGEPSVLDSLKCVRTQVLKLSGVSSRLSGEMMLEKIAGVRMSAESVEYSAGVERYVELVRPFEVKAKHVPKGRRLMLYPSAVDVTFKCRFPSRFSVDSVSFYVDYNEFLSARSGKCFVRADGLTRDVFDYSISPEVVECIPADK